VLRIGCPALFLAGSAAWWAWRGVPAARDTLFAWVLVGLLAFSVTDLRGRARGVVYRWLPLAAVLWLYDLSRGAADGLLFRTHYRGPLDADRALFRVVPTAWLQWHLWHGQRHLQWYDYAAWLVYLSYFFATILLAAALCLLAPERFRRYAASICTLSTLGVVTYVLFPAAPPWLAAEHHLTHGLRLVPAIWAHIPYVSFQTLFEHGSHYSNRVAAVPSLHTAFTLLVTITLWPLAPRTLKPLLVLYPLAMGFALVYLGEHWVFDALLGYMYAAATVAIVHVTAGALARRRARSSELFGASPSKSTTTPPDSAAVTPTASARISGDYPFGVPYR
jgi:hypothetical protein